jgi:hypothetical protein
MKRHSLLWASLLVVSVVASSTGRADSVSPELKAKIDAKVTSLKWIGTDPKVVAAVKEQNANPPADVKAMTQDKWKSLSLLDPMVKGFARNAVAEYLKGKKDEAVSELFVSCADGTKVAFFTKPTNWSHAGKDKHDLAMKNKPWIGPVEVDESTGVQQVQSSFPVLDGGKPIGSVVVGLAVAKL